MREKNAKQDYYKQLSAMGTRIASEAMNSNDFKETMKELSGLATSFKSKKQKETMQQEVIYEEDPKEEINKVKKNAIPRIQPVQTTQPADKANREIESVDINKLREAMVLSEIIGKPACKTRRARRI